MGASKQLKGQYEILHIIVSSMKTPRHVNYHPKQESNGTFLDGVETPFSVGLALQVHKETHNRKIIDCLSELNLTIDNKKVLKTDIVNAVYGKHEQNNGVYVPPDIVHQMPVLLVVDNTDFHSDTPDGKKEFHGIGQIIPSISKN